MTAKAIVKASGAAIGLGALLLGTAVMGTSGASASDPPGQAEAKSEQDRSRRICRTLTPSGTRLTRRACRTRAEWEASANKAADGVAEQQFEHTSTYEQERPPL